MVRRTAAVLLLLGSGFLATLAPSRAQEKKGGDDPAATTKADDKAIAEMKVALDAATKELATTQKDLKSLKDDAAEQAKKAEARYEEAVKAAKERDAAVAEFMSKQPTPKAEDPKKADDTKKAEDDAKKTLDEIKATGEKGVADAATALTTAKERGDTAWMLTSSALVMFMVPGLALFYAGMVRRKNVLATMMESMAALAVVGVFWVAVGYGLAFGPSAVKISALGVEDGGVIGWSWDLFFLRNVETTTKLPGLDISVYLHVMFQGMFAIITPALISGAVAERIRFWPFCIFMILWVSFVYCPLAHMVWAFDWFDPTVLQAKRGTGAIGLLGKMGALDFAGGTVVHIAAGMAGLACCLVLRRRTGYPKMIAHPNSMVLTLLGAGLLWFGWFGFNGGSAVNSTTLAVSAFAATQAATAAAGLAWMAVEWLHKGKPTGLGLASGIVAGLVAVTPASGFVYMWGAVAIGVAAAVVCYLAVNLKNLLGYDDSLDAFGVHGVGGFVGAVLTGVFCSAAVNTAGADGPFAYKAHRAKYDELKPVDGTDGKPADSKPIAEAKAEVEKAKKAVEEAEAGVKAAGDDKDKKADADKKLTEAKDILADKETTAAGLEKELKDLITLIDKQDDKEHDGKDKKSGTSQVVIQFKAAAVSAVFAFALSLVLALLVQAMTLGNFSTSVKDEADGLDRTEHGEVGFDFSGATESVAVVGATPRAAEAPPAGNGRFELELTGAKPADLIAAWSALCQPTDKPADPNFSAVYKHVTTIQGTRFRCRGGNPTDLAKRVEALFQKKLGPGVHVHKV